MATSSFQVCVVYSLGTRRGRHSSRANYGAMPPNQGAEDYSAEWRALKVGEWARYGEGWLLPNRLERSGERHKLLQQGLGLHPGWKHIFGSFEGRRTLHLTYMLKHLGERPTLSPVQTQNHAWEQESLVLFLALQIGFSFIFVHAVVHWRTMHHLF